MGHYAGEMGWPGEASIMDELDRRDWERKMDAKVAESARRVLADEHPLADKLRQLGTREFLKGNDDVAVALREAAAELSKMWREK